MTSFLILDVYDPDDSNVWANVTKELLGFSPDIVFTSEDYGHLYSKYLNAKHI